MSRKDCSIHDRSSLTTPWGTKIVSVYGVDIVAANEPSQQKRRGEKETEVGVNVTRSRDRQMG